MSHEKPFRTVHICVSRGVYEALLVLCPLEGYSCPDEAADVKLGLLLSTRADIPWAKAAYRKAMDGYREAYAEHVKAIPEDELP